MTKSKIIFQYFLLAIFIVMAIFCFTGCQSTDQQESYIETASIETAKCEYDSGEDRTKIIWSTTLTNNTIYNFDGFSVTYKLYNNASLITTETYNYSTKLTHGEKYTGSFYFYADGEIDTIEYVSWQANYLSFWQTYSVWFIVTIIIVALAALIYIILMIINDLELDDVFEFIEDHCLIDYIFFILLICFGIWELIISNWVPLLIVLGGIIALVIIVLIAHLIKYIVEETNIDFSTNQKSKINKKNVNKKNNLQKLTSTEFQSFTEEELQNFTLIELRNYCRNNNIKGYSKLNKNQILKLISKKGVSNSGKENEHKITFEDIAGLEKAKQAFKEKVVWAFEHKDLYKKYGKKTGGGILLYGLPGTGKTMFAQAASNEVDALFIPIKCSDIKSKWYGESEQKIKQIFNKARKAGKAIIFFDEFEAIGAKRTDNADNGNNDLVPQLLEEMQGLDPSNNKSTILVIAATNKPWSIDSAFLRPGRFDDKLYIPLPDKQARKKMCELKLQQIPSQQLDYAKLSELTGGFSGADITEFCEKLKMEAIRISISTKKEHLITMQDAYNIASKMKSSVSKEDTTLLKLFEENNI